MGIYAVAERNTSVGKLILLCVRECSLHPTFVTP